MRHNFKARLLRLTLNILAAAVSFSAASLVTAQITSDTVYASCRYSFGCKGEVVKIIQTKLKALGYYYAGVDGCFGPATLNAVKSFQRDYGLQVDGVVGTKTFTALNASSIPDKHALRNEAVAVSSASDDYDAAVWLLACVINGEGRGESYEGQVAIGAVILNRLSSPYFPDNLIDIIFQPGQFSAVNDGQINLQPSESCFQAARDAIAGRDPVNGALYFWNPKTATSKWVKNLTVTKQIGNHVFAANP